MLKSKKKLNELDMVKKLIDFILPLVSAEEEKDEEEPYEFEETQVSVAKLVHLVSCKKLSLYYSIVVFLKSTFFQVINAIYSIIYIHYSGREDRRE